MTAENNRTNEDIRYWPTIAGAIGGLAVSVGVVIPEMLLNQQQLTPTTASIAVGLASLFVASTSVLGTIAGNRRH